MVGDQNVGGGEFDDAELGNRAFDGRALGERFEDFGFAPDAAGGAEFNKVVGDQGVGILDGDALADLGKRLFKFEQLTITGGVIPGDEFAPLNRLCCGEAANGRCKIMFCCDSG